MHLSAGFTNELHKYFAGELREDLASRILYSTDASIYQIEPKAVAIPKTQEDLQGAVELAAKYKVPILARGAGTSLAGQAIGNALIVDCSRWLDHIVEINPEERYAIVEPGVVLSNLNKAAAKHGLQYGPDPASADRATMGGVIANNATGAHSLVYGMCADHLISTDVIMSDGSLGLLGERSTLDNPLISNFHSSALEIREKYADAITKHWPTTWRNSAGYRLNYLLPWSPSMPSEWAGEYPAINPLHINLAPLLAGSEGTLAIIRRAQVNLVPRPQHTILAVLSYQSNTDACDDVPRLLTHHPSAVELIPRFIIRQARSVPAYARQMGWVVGDPAALLVVEFSGDKPSALKEAARHVGEVLTLAESKEDQARVWNVRKVGLGLLDSRPQSARPVAFIEDCAIPVQRLGDFVREVEKILSAHETEAGIYAHASAGCLHIRPILDLKTSHGVTDLREISEAVLALTLKLGGAMSSEHGDGLARAEYLESTYGRELMDAMRMLKRAADPNNILNPGKIFDPPKMDTNLRYGAHYRTRAWDSNLSFARNGGFGVAIEQCNGQGLCRKERGVMCPSYQATREEMHSTRGRANLLRALISDSSSLRGANGESNEAISHSTRRSLRRDFDAPRLNPSRHDIMESVFQALDLCLACKGCKAECPSGVDMAKLKFAFQEEYYKAHRRQLRDYVFGYFHLTAGLAASIAPLANAMMQIPLFKNLIAQKLGITTHRPFPQFIRAAGGSGFSHSRSGTHRKEQGGIPSDTKVVFLSDPFARYIEPQTEQAALGILSMCGFDIHVVPMLGAGASLLSKGFVDAARRHAGRLLDALSVLDPARKAPIIGIEPPEIYTLKHDYVDLIPEREEEISQRLGNLWLMDEFLLRSNELNALRVARMEKHNPRHNNQPGNDRETGASGGAPLSLGPPRNVRPKLKFHPHCHQRAEGLAPDGLPIGTNASVELLHLCGYDVELLDTGCCGMAGTFGYEAEHYDLSMKIGALKLFPALAASHPPLTLRPDAKLPGKGPQVDMGEVSRGDGGEEVVVSTGAACRMQIKHGTGIDAQHSIVMVARALFSH